ncbi:hypothetical protein APY94_01605 [Thermococcus celericrescens]|uniref:Uncharacterized protein n=2 Tax=Thermococcus celericrescens TaxID=227598 RepID=A0A124EBM0_9EURY|nr:DUF4855 domain-containing protein [Thermococcus celericrescens]KUH34540.1 hypothetical protein APY94_01605 [Thermococcus celericrescens]
MANFGLWWIRWNGSNYESRMNGSLREFKGLGFDYAVILGQPAHIQYTGDAETDAYNLSEYLSDYMNMPYYVTIPFFTPAKTPRGNITGSFEGSYWERWINVFAGSSDPNLRGFYWSLENAWMFKQDQIEKGVGISYELIKAMSQKIHSAGFEFIWIPSVPTMNIEGTNIFPWYYSPNYPGACEYFDYVFAQPNYYMGRINNINGWTLNLEGLKLKYNCWNVFMEMEADECVIGGGGNCKTCSDSINCTKLASDYVQAQINNIGRKYPQRAYYFGVTFDVVRQVDSYCISNLGVPYV